MESTWKRFQDDFDAMTDEQIADDVRQAEFDLEEAESWLEAVASWEAAGRPRYKKEEG